MQCLRLLNNNLNFEYFKWQFYYFYENLIKIKVLLYIYITILTILIKRLTNNSFLLYAGDLVGVPYGKQQCIETHFNGKSVCK